MRIRRVNVESFGAVNGYFADFSDKDLTLVYGDNEAGKTTVTEFIRGTIFNGKNARYPAQKRTDSGYVEVQMENGETKMLVREGRRVYEKESKTLPSDDLHMDAETYRSLFSMDIDQISDDKMISNGDFRRKFLTVPGGEHVPDVSRFIENRMSKLSTRERMSDTREIGAQRKRLKDIESRLAEVEDNIDSYNDLVSLKEKLGHELDDARLMQDREAYEKNKAFMFESMKENAAKLEELRAREDEIEYADRLTDSDIRRYDELRMRLVTLDNLIESGALDENEAGDMTAQDAREILSHSEEIDRVWSSRARMEILEGAVTDLRESMNRDSEDIAKVSEELGLSEDAMLRIAKDSEVREVLRNPDNRRTVSRKTINIFSKRKRIVASVFGLIALLGCFVHVNAFAVVLCAAFIFAINIMPSVFDLYCRVDDIEWSTWLPEKGFAGVETVDRASQIYDGIESIAYELERRDLSRSRCAMFEDEMHDLTMKAREVTSRMKIGTGSVFRDLNEMYRIYSKAKEIIDAFSESDGLAEKKASVVKELDELISRYGTETDLVDMRVVRDELISLRIRIKELEEALESANRMSTDVINRIVSDTEGEDAPKVDSAKLIEELNMRIGEVSSEMRHIVNDDTASECLVEKCSIETRFNELLREWAVYSIADHIINECCTKFYADLQPAVIKTANKYLELMTGGRYRLISDPRDSTLSIEDGKTKKTVGEWSSGLSDQVYLSVKMAIAKEMGTERLPLVIDDILVRFDGRRKQGACRAIKEFSKDQQVIMFTCDSTLVSLFRFEGDVNYIELH